MLNAMTQQLQPVTQAAVDPTIHIQPVAFFDASGNPITLTGIDDPLTGYVIAATAAAVSATDSVRTAIAKLEKRIVDLEAQVDALENP